MSATNRLRYNGVLAGTAKPTLGAALADGSGTTITFAAALNYQGATAVPTIADPNYLPLTLEPDTANEEIVWLTAYTSGATTGTVLRAQEGTTGVAHANGTSLVHGPTVLDITPSGSYVQGDTFLLMGA